MLRLASLIERLARAARRIGREGAAMVATPLHAPRAARRRRPSGPAPARRRRPRVRLLEQTALDLGPPRPRWTFSRLAERSPHKARMLEHLEFTRRFFPELEGVTIHVGLAQKRGVLGWGSMDPERPGVWIRPRRLYLFTIAHEFTHLLQARGLVPRGERSCDLFALARSSMLVDHAPSYLKLPRALRRPKLRPGQARLLTDCARLALAAREAGDRRYLQRFERLLEEAVLG
ncbi:MAG: hypothetical protein IT347_11995 [Candidatus Eisenbacteria bacterium]|nr:hypothetical protein [Candidatus Eisenbacteria bacterium]